MYSCLIAVSLLIVYKNTTEVHTQNGNFPLHVIDMEKKSVENALKIENVFTFISVSGKWLSKPKLFFPWWRKMQELMKSKMKEWICGEGSYFSLVSTFVSFY